MAVNVRLKWNLPAFRAIRTSDAAVALVGRHAAETAAGCGEGFDVDNQVPRNRAHSTVYPITVEASIRNSRDNTLLRNLR